MPKRETKGAGERPAVSRPRPKARGAMLPWRNGLSVSASRATPNWTYGALAWRPTGGFTLKRGKILFDTDVFDTSIAKRDVFNDPPICPVFDLLPNVMFDAVEFAELSDAELVEMADYVGAFHAEIEHTTMAAWRRGLESHAAWMSRWEWDSRDGPQPKEERDPEPLPFELHIAATGEFHSLAIGIVEAAKLQATVSLATRQPFARCEECSRWIKIGGPGNATLARFCSAKCRVANHRRKAGA